MRKEIFQGDGFNVFEDGGRIILRYDAGEICDRMDEIEITLEDFERAKKSSMDAYHVIIEYQNKKFQRIWKK